MRRRAAFLALVAGGLAAGAGVAFSAPRELAHDTAARAVVLARADLADAPAPSTLDRARGVPERDHESRRGAVAVVAIALAALLGASWSLVRDRDAATRRAFALTRHRPRAPPRMPAIVHR